MKIVFDSAGLTPRERQLVSSIGDIVWTLYRSVGAQAGFPPEDAESETLSFMASHFPDLNCREKE